MEVIEVYFAPIQIIVTSPKLNALGLLLLTNEEDGIPSKYLS